MFISDDETSGLLRQATAFRDGGDITTAIACLKEAQRRMMTSKVSYPCESWLRLPLYLQAAGRFEEAKAEFEFLLNDAKPRIQREFAHQFPRCQKMLTHAVLSTIYDKMRLAYTREGLMEEAKPFDKKSRHHKAQHAKLMPIVEAERKERHRKRMEEYLTPP